jgi:hypothetical protein
MSSIRGGSQRDRNWERGTIRIAKASTPTATKMAKAGAHHPMTEVNAAPTQAKTTISTVTARPASTKWSTGCLSTLSPSSLLFSRKWREAGHVGQVARGRTDRAVHALIAHLEQVGHCVTVQDVYLVLRHFLIDRRNRPVVISPSPDEGAARCLWSRSLGSPAG